MVRKVPPLSAGMLPIVLICSLSLAATGQQADGDWIDPYDMLNYDSSTKTMRKPAEPEKYDNVQTTRRESTQDSTPAELAMCNSKIENLEKKIVRISQQPTCSPVFKRFLRRLLNEIQRVGLPSDSTDTLYDASIKLSRQDMNEIQRLLDDEDSWRTGALDNAISQILQDLKPHDREAWKWRFEDTFGVELDTVLKMLLVVLVITVIISTELWSVVSWFKQFKRMFVLCFFTSLIWNWFYLYKISFAEHQNNLAKMNNYEKCSGMNKIHWSDSLKEWWRKTMTLEDDPCKKYYEALLVDPILLVPPNKALLHTITTLFTEPLKHIGQGIGEFLRALFKDLPVTLQIPVFVALVLFVWLLISETVKATFLHGIAAPFRRLHRDPPQLEQPRRHLQGPEDNYHLAGGDAVQPALRPRADDDGLHRIEVRQRRHNIPREELAKLVVLTVRTAEQAYSEDETDARPRESERNLSVETHTENEEELAGATASCVVANPAQSKTESDSPQSMKLKENLSKDELRKDSAASQPAARRPQQTDVQDLQAPGEDRTSAASLTQVETVGTRVPVQESTAASAD